MKIMQMTKRIFLFVLVNILVMVTITAILGLLRVGNYFPAGGLTGSEEKWLEGVGYTAISLGPLRLRAETATDGAPSRNDRAVSSRISRLTARVATLPAPRLRGRP